jgi:hypothetical protein
MRKNCLLLFLLCLAFSGCTSRVITVSIHNASDAPIRNVEVSFNGGSYGVSSIAPGKTHLNHIKPFGPSTLNVEYLDATGNKKTQIGPRVAKNDTGTVQINIDNNGFKWTEPQSQK